MEIIALKEEVAAAATEQDTKMAALEAKVAEMQALAAASLQRPTLYLTHASHTLRTLRTLRTLHAICAVSTPASPASSAGSGCS